MIEEMAKLRRAIATAICKYDDDSAHDPHADSTSRYCDVPHRCACEDSGKAELCHPYLESADAILRAIDKSGTFQLVSRRQ